MSLENHNWNGKSPESCDPEATQLDRDTQTIEAIARVLRAAKKGE